MIFVDTSFWIALHVPRDQRHTDAAAALEKFHDRQLLTSSQVRGETWTFLTRRGRHADAVRFLDRTERTARLRVVFVTEELEDQALRWLRRRDERRYSFVDATSFALMRSLRVREALAFDADFAAAGFTELRA
ncbi:MAG: type II toxin-antitoxin system VapC family toxin [Actinobacteria bacterium]|nr:type II toxin-antitoxin system VapC family toxin [Actinomycetota bacterium]